MLDKTKEKNTNKTEKQVRVAISIWSYCCMLRVQKSRWKKYIYQSLYDKKSDASDSRWVCWRINEDMCSRREAEHQPERQSIGAEY